MNSFAFRAIKRVIKEEKKGRKGREGEGEKGLIVRDQRELKKVPLSSFPFVLFGCCNVMGCDGLWCDGTVRLTCCVAEGLCSWKAGGFDVVVSSSSGLS